ncbi:MAG: type IV pilus secretin PilQ [Thermodesulfobacteriota bacterium]
MKSSRLLKIFLFGGLLLFLVSCAARKTTVPPPSPEAQGKMAKVSVIQKITFAEEENYTRIHIEGSEAVAPPFYKLMTDPLRIAIDVPNIDLREIQGPIKVENGTIGEILTTQYDDKGRIEIGLMQVANYNISKEDKNLIIDIEKVKKVAEVKAEAKAEAEAEEAIKEKEEKPPVQPPAEKELPKAKEIVNFSMESKKDYVVFHIIGDGKIENYDAFKLEAPARLVLDIWGVDTRYPQKSIKSKNAFIRVVRIGKHSDKLRLVFDSAKPQLAPYQINPLENRLIVSIGNVPQPSEPQILLPEKVAEAAKVKRPIEKVQVKSPVDFKQMDHQSRIVVTLTGEPTYESYMISKDTLAVDIKNAFVPKHLQRPLDTKEFDSAVQSIQMQNVKAGKWNDVRVLIKLREEVPFHTTKEGKVLFIDIQKPKKAEGKIEPGVPPKREAVAEAKKEDVKEEEKPTPEKPAPERPVAEPKIAEPKVREKKTPVEEKVPPQPTVIKREQQELPEKVYTGRKLSLDFKDADIKNILRLIAEVSNFNVITADDVTGKITMRLVDVPWDQALDVVLQAKGLGKVQVGNVIWVAPREALKKQEQDLLEQRRAKERLEDLVDDLVPINYATAKDIMPQVKGILSERGDIKVDERTNTLIVKDIASKVAKVKNLVKLLDTKTPQILIEARIVEAGLSFQRELGIKWGFQLSHSGATRSVVGGGVAGTQTVLNVDATGYPTGTATTYATREVLDFRAFARSAVPGATATTGILEAIFSRGSLQMLDVAISAHENKGDIKIISSPKIATLDNKEASIEQGLRIPYPKLTTEGTVTTDFIDANLKLTVTPHVTSDGNVKMIVKAKKDAPDRTLTVLGVPSIDKKEAITEVLVKDGGVAAIAGIYTIDTTDAAEGIPLLSKIPLLGWLFKREVKEDTRKDLLIFISPKIYKEQI